MQTELSESDPAAAVAAAEEAPQAFGDDGVESWDIVHVTPATAERELASITAQRCFVLHSTADFNAPPSPFHTTTAATARHGDNAPHAHSINDTTTAAAAEAPTPLLLHGDCADVPRPKDAANTQHKLYELSMGVGDSCSAAGHNPDEVFGAYRRVRVIHNTAPCLIRCAVEAGSAPLNFTSALQSSSNNAVGSSSVMSGGPQPAPLQPHPHSPAAAPRAADQSSSSLMQVLPHSIHEASGWLSISQVSRPQHSYSSFTSTTTGAGGSKLGGSLGLLQSTSQQLQRLASAYDRCAPRRVSRVSSSRRSHASSTALPESVVFLDPLEIIADAAISFVDVAFAAHVSVKGKGTVQFVNCCFGQHSTAQLYRQFISNPPAAETDFGEKAMNDDALPHPNAMSTPAMDLVQAETVMDAAGDSSVDSGQLSGWVAPVVSAVDHVPPVVSSQEHDSNNPASNSSKPLAWGSPAREGGESSSSGVFGLHAGFALPTTMRMNTRRRSSATSNEMRSPDGLETPEGFQHHDNSHSNTNTTRSPTSASPSKATPSTLATMTGINDSAAMSVLDINGDSCCVLSQCDLYGGCAGASLVCRDRSHISVTDSSFDGPSITWAAVEVRDTAEATMLFTNIQQVLGVGVLVADHGRATVDSSVIERCGVAGVVATDYATVSLENTGVEASVSGVCVSLSGSAEAQMVGCGFTTRFPLPRHAAGLMFVEHLQSLGAYFPLKGETDPTSTAPDSKLSAAEDVLLQHTLHMDLESLMGLWFVHMSATDVAFLTSSQSFVLCDRAVAVVTECEFTCTMRLPSTFLASTSTNIPSAGGNNTMGTNNNNDSNSNTEENAPTNGSRANRSDGRQHSFTGLPPAVASVVAARLSSSEEANSGGLSTSSRQNKSNKKRTSSHAVLLPNSSLTRRLTGVIDESGMRKSLTHATRRPVTTFDESAEDIKHHETPPLLVGSIGNVLSSSFKTPAPSEATTAAAAATQIPSASPPHPSFSSAGSLLSSLPLSVRRVIAGLLSSYVMTREVFGEYLCEKRRTHAATCAFTHKNTMASSSPLGNIQKTDALSAVYPRRFSAGDRTRTELFLSFEAFTEVDKEDGKDTSSTRLSLTEARSATSRRLSNISVTAMHHLQESLHQLGCLPVLMAPNGGVYHIVVSNQASLVLTSSVLSLARAPQFMAMLPSARVSTVDADSDGEGGGECTSPPLPAAFVAAVLDYNEADKTISHVDRRESDSATVTSQPQQQRPERTNLFCSIFTRSNVIQYECVSMTNTREEEDDIDMMTAQDGKAPSTTAAGGGPSSQQREDGKSTKDVSENAAESIDKNKNSGVGNDGNAQDGDHNSSPNAIARKESEINDTAKKSAPPPPLSTAGGDDDNNSSSPTTAAEFNHAAWGLVLVTPQAKHCSESLLTAVRAQAEHWCKAELTTTSAVSAVLPGGSGESSFTATPATDSGEQLEVPAPLRKPNAKVTAGRLWPSRSADGLTRAAGGSISFEPTFTANLSETFKSDFVDYAGANGTDRRGGGDGGDAAGTPTEATDTRNSQVHHLGNIFLNMANQAELLSVTHPEHICTTFSHFAHTMELPAAKNYPLYPSPEGPLSPKPSLAAWSSHLSANISSATIGTTMPTSPRNAIATLIFEGGAGEHKAATEAGHSTPNMESTAAPAVLRSVRSPTSLCERDISRLHLNTDMQRQLLLDDVDAPPFLAAAAAGREEAAIILNTHDSTQPLTVNMLRSHDKAKANVANFSSVPAPPLNQSSLLPESAGVALPTSVSRAQVLSMNGNSKEKQEALLLLAANAPTSAHSSLPSSHVDIFAVPSDGAGGDGCGNDEVAAQLPTNTTGAVLPPSPPPLSILEVESVGSSSYFQSSISNTNTNTNTNMFDVDMEDGVEGESNYVVSGTESCGNVGGGNRVQAEKRSKWALVLKQSTSNSHDSAELERNSEHGSQKEDGEEEEKEEETQPGTEHASSNRGADLMGFVGEESELQSSRSSHNCSNDSSGSNELDAEQENDGEGPKSEGQHNKSGKDKKHTHNPPLSPTSKPSTASSRSASPSHSLVPFPGFQLFPPSPELLSSVPPTWSNGTSAVEGAEQPPRASSPKVRSSTTSSALSSYSSKGDRDGENADGDDVDGEPQLQLHSITRAMAQSPFSSNESSPRTSPKTRHRKSGSPHQTLPPVKKEEKCDALEAPNVPVALEAALERMSQLEEQMQRIMMLQQRQMAQVHSAFQQSSTSQSSLLVLPPILKDGRAAQSNSYWSSFSSSKIQSPATSRKSPNQSILDPTPTYTTTATGPTTIVATQGDEDAKQEASLKLAADTPPSAQPHPPAQPLKDPKSEEQEHLPSANEKYITRVPPPTKQENDNANNNSNQLNMNLAASSSSSGDVTSAPPPPQQQQQQKRRPSPSTEAASPQVSTTSTALTPSPPLSLPPNATHSPLLRARVRRPLSSSTIDLLLAAAHHSVLGVPFPYQVTGTAGGAGGGGSIEDINHAEYNRNSPLNVQRQYTETQMAEAYAREQGWQDELLQRLRTVHLGNANADPWPGRPYYPPPSTSTTVSTRSPVSGQSTCNAKLHRYMKVGENTGAGDDWKEEKQREDTADYDEGDNDALRSGSNNPAVAFEPWRNTVATGTRYTYRPPPHPYSCFTRTSTSINLPPDLAAGNYDEGEPLRWREPVPPPLVHTSSGPTSSRSSRARRPHRLSSIPVLPLAYIDSVSSSQVSPNNAFYSPCNALTVPTLTTTTPTTATTTSVSSSAYGGIPHGLYLSGYYRGSRLRHSTHPSPPTPLPQPQQQRLPSPPHYWTTPTFSPPTLSPYIAHLHEDYLNDKYARAAWDAMLAQSRAQERKQQRLTSPRQSAQVYRLYTEPMRERMSRAAALERPTREQLFRQHGCTFTPKINQNRIHKRHSVPQRRTEGETCNRPLRSVDTSIDSVRVPSAVPTNSTTMTCGNAAVPGSPQGTPFMKRRRLPSRKMPLERVHLARGKDEAASGTPSADKFTATPEELRVIQEKMKDPVFMELMQDYMKSLEDPETRREEEAYLEQAEREAREGGDFSFEFVFPRAAYVVELLEPSNTRITAAEAKRLGGTAATVASSESTQKITAARSFLNMCQSDKVKAFTEHTTGDRNGSNWEVPVSVSQRRVEVYNPIAASPSAKIPAEYAAAADASSSPRLCIVHDVVFHPTTLQLAERSNKFMCFLTEIAVEHLNGGYGESNGFKFRRLPSSIVSIGTPQNQTLRTKHGTNPFAVDPRDPVLQRPTRQLPTSMKSTPTTQKEAKISAVKAEEKSVEPTTATLATAPTGSEPATKLPPYTITHRGSIDLTDAWRWSVSDKRIGVPEELIIKLTFAEVRRAAALDITITADGHAVRIDRTAGQPLYEGEVTLPFTVEEEPTQAQFDRTRGVLTLTLKVVPPPLPDGVPTAEELRRTLPGGMGRAETSAEKDAKEQESPTAENSAAAVVATAPTVEEEKDSLKSSAQQPVVSPSSAPDTTAPAPSTLYETVEQVKASRDESIHESLLASKPATASNRPEVEHIGNQDRVATMMAQVAAARAARVAAAAKETDEEKLTTSSPTDNVKPDDPDKPAHPSLSEESPQIETTHTVSAPTNSGTQTDCRSPYQEGVNKDSGKETRKGDDDIPFIRKGTSQPAAADLLTGDVTTASTTTDDVEAVRARQQAWVAMMEAEMKVARAREEAEGADALRAAEVQAAKARRKLAAEKERERLEQLAQEKRNTLPLSNKYIFAID